MTDQERPRAVLKLPTGDVEIDPLKWFAPVTRAEFFTTIQQIRSMVFMSTTFTSMRTSGEAEQSLEMLAQIRRIDDAMMKKLTDTFAMVAPDE